MRIVISLENRGFVEIHTKDGYSPDVLDDLCTRAQKIITESIVPHTITPEPEP